VSLGLERGIVRLVPYTSEWRLEFTRERERLFAALRGTAVAIEHVGSTAVPGLRAKPVLDIMVGLPRVADHERALSPMDALGYRYKGEHGIPGRHYFRLGEPCTHHLHMVSFGREFWLRHLLFRDHLRAHAEVAQAYEAVKLELFARHPKDRPAYQDGKTDFIESVLREIR